MDNSSKFSNQLFAFIEQSKTDNLKTKHFINHYEQTEVKVSFGQGVKARIPWISFLKEPNTTSNGIYPVYLFYKDLNKLILAYGVSEKTVPNSSWDIKNLKTISKYFDEKKLGKPERYGESFIYKVYDVEKLPADEVIDNDLNMLIQFYLQNTINSSPERTEFAMFDRLSFIDCLEKVGLQLNPKLTTRFISSLLTKPFVILTGLSGSGKTKLAQAFVQWICGDESQYRLIPVGADWTNREPLLGYPNAIRPEEYVMPDSGVLELIIQASNQPDLPYFLILDEMNLSHVERYFADFLSVMESKEEIPLYAKGTVENGVPANLKVPSNLFIIGTVNIDETTNMFSPKVLDRANTIEFRVTQEEMKNFLGNIRAINMDALTGKGAGMAKSFLDMSANKSFEKDEEVNAVLIKFFGELKKTGAEFGYRSATEILRLIHQLTILDNTLTINQKIDIAIMQKLLPKLHGSRRKLCPVLETLGSFCISGELQIIRDVFGNSEFDFSASHVLYPLSLEKIARMYRGALDNGFASFAEA
jgi:5-methylcytosine-specific restriction protein B